jgi:FtsH-binding integral membrane protein
MMSVSWLFILGGFMVAGWVASRAAQTAQSRPAQYAALAGYVVIESLIFLPLLLMANQVAPGAISSAGLVTILGFAALTGIAFYTRKDFSFLRGALMWGGAGAMLLVIAGVIFGFQLGVFFSVAMVVLAGAAILYDTSNVVHHFPEDRYVAASLQLFSSVTLMFWYVLRIFMSRR